jgi:hypothetical protein
MKGDKRRCTLQKKRAKQLMEAAGLGDWDQPCGEEEVRKVEDALPDDYQIRIYNQPQFSARYYPDPKAVEPHPRRNAPNIITLYLFEGHIEVVTSLPALMGKRFWCFHCESGYSVKERHNCPAVCQHCRKTGKCTENVKKECIECRRWFVSEECFQRHKAIEEPKNTLAPKARCKTKSTCQSLKRCLKCGRHVGNLEAHGCGLRYCEQCNEQVPRDELLANGDGVMKHQCFMKPIVKKQKKQKKQKKTPVQRRSRKRKHSNAFVQDEAEEDDEEEEEEEEEVEREFGEETQAAISEGRGDLKAYVFFDFESSQELLVRETADGKITKHQVISAHARYVCIACADERNEDCPRCYEKFFFGNNTIDAFCYWFLALENVIALAHNCKGYDGQFILEYLNRKSLNTPKIIVRGMQLIKIEIGTIKILDSLSFLPFALGEFPKAFNIKEVKKGFFPYLFIKVSKNF